MGRGRAAALAAWLVLTGCAMPSSGTAEVPPELVGTTWQAETIAGQPVLAGVVSTVSFAASDRIAGSGGCNRYGGALRREGGRLQVGPLVSTRMACAPEVMAQEDRFLAAIEAAERFRREGARLFLDSTGSAEPSRFRPFVPAETPPG